MILGMLTLEAQ